MFVETRRDLLLIGDRCYREGSVVEVDERRANDLLREGVALPHPGPAAEPEPEPEPEPEDAAPPAPRGRNNRPQ